MSMSKESFAQRRQLFQEVWASAMDDDSSRRPKVVKTLNLDVMERSTGKRRKQKIKNLRSVCQKLVEYCDRQEVNSPAMSLEPQNRRHSYATYSGHDSAKPKPKRRHKTSLKLSKSAANR